jgi:hypothetical protein
LTLDERGAYEICAVCFWEDDGTQAAVEAARVNFRRLGACREQDVPHVRPPLADEIPVDDSALPLPEVARIKRRRRLP